MSTKEDNLSLAEKISGMNREFIDLLEACDDMTESSIANCKKRTTREAESKHKKEMEEIKKARSAIMKGIRENNLNLDIQIIYTKWNDGTYTKDEAREAIKKLMSMGETNDKSE